MTLARLSLHLEGLSGFHVQWWACPKLGETMTSTVLKLG